MTLKLVQGVKDHQMTQSAQSINYPATQGTIWFCQNQKGQSSTPSDQTNEHNTNTPTIVL